MRNYISPSLCWCEYMSQPHSQSCLVNPTCCCLSGLPDTRPSNDISIEFDIHWNLVMDLFIFMFRRSQRNFALVTSLLSWRVQNVFVICWTHFTKPLHCKFSSNLYRKLQINSCPHFKKKMIVTCRLCVIYVREDISGAGPPLQCYLGNDSIV